MFPSISPKQSFPALESDVLAYWKTNNTFQKSIDSRPESNPYRFYDGPPFITGTPHYGNLLSSVVKDVVARYWTMQGKRVERIWGWDCHGLPIEEKVQKKLGLSSNKEIEERGVKEFIDGCYEYTAKTSEEWPWYVDKIGRWVDMDRAYRTMDQDYMESVMWVFSELYRKGLIYEGKRVSLYSWKLGTPISNFEVAMDDSYQEVNDPAITVKFRIPERDAAIALVTDDQDRFLLGWSYKYNGWHLVGGAVDAGESLEDAIVREIEEEISVRVSKDQLIPFAQESQLDQAAFWRATHFQVKIDPSALQNNEPKKFREWKWFTKEELVSSYDEIYEVDKLIVDMFLGRAPIQKKAPSLSVLAWTTTPWTILANMALAVRNDIDYIIVESGEEQYIVAKNRVENVFKGKGEYTIIREMKGSELVGLSYVPPFPEYYHEKNGEKNHRIYHADFITDTDGTGIGHEAPEFGDVDFQLAKKEGIHLSEAMDEAGKYTSQIFDYEGLHYQEANGVNIERMKANGTLFKLESITHRVPFCPRSATPLVQKAQKSWFIDIQSQKEKLKEANKLINWSPDHLKFGRFAKGLESAPDWCISRTRFWGAPMPVWQNSDGSERVVVSSREEIYEANKAYGQLEKREIEGKVKYSFKGGEFDGQELNLHKPYIDSIFLAPKNARKPKKVLAVHGYRSRGIHSGYDGAFLPIQDLLKEEGIQFDVPDFDKSVETSYAKWKETLQNLKVSEYDTILATSFGCPVIMQYILENKIKIPRLILVAPSGCVGNEYLEKVLPELTEDVSQLSNLVDEIVIIHSKNDDSTSAPFSYGVTLHEKTGGVFLAVDGFKHKFGNWSPSLISGLIQHGAPLARVSEVLDVWLDSGAMPYAQMHYPFENKAPMEASFPADFIAEYTGQVRAWFYVMHVLGVLLMGKPAFTNVITTGVVKGSDGRKMSKSLGNFPDPRSTIETHGSDPIRLYMLNSPLLSGGDMDFKEEGIIDTVKRVILPLWNTYSFFTTYANIDGWKPSGTVIDYMRHGKTALNQTQGALGADDRYVSGGLNDHELIEEGIEYSHTVGREMKSKGVEYDVIVSSGMRRTNETARIIADELGYTGEIYTDTRLKERMVTEQYEGRVWEEVKEEYRLKYGKLDIPAGLHMLSVLGGAESDELVNARISEAYEDIRMKYAGKRILIVAHGNVFRSVVHHVMGVPLHQVMTDRNYRIKNNELIHLPVSPLTNPLDRWMYGELSTLVGKVQDSFERYDLQTAAASLVSFMDDLTNWYVRRSRRRFWKSENDSDKSQAYETLYHVLTTLCKVAAPMIPFVTESVYRGLTGRESVHLDMFPSFERTHVSTHLLADMKKTRDFITLGLSLRSSKKIRVRQPLQSITIGETLDPYFVEILREELNIKEVIVSDMSAVARQICRPDAKILGPRIGKAVQEVIREAKSGNFTSLASGQVQVGEYVLESNEFTLAYEPLLEGSDVEGDGGLVIMMNSTVTEELRLEGVARDLIRVIQDMRKEAGYEVTDRISVSLIGDQVELLSSFIGMICEETLADSIVNVSFEIFDIQRELEIEDGILVVAVVKI